MKGRVKMASLQVAGCAGEKVASAVLALLQLHTRSSRTRRVHITHHAANGLVRARKRSFNFVTKSFRNACNFSCANRDCNI